MKNLSKTWILLFYLICCFIIPNVKGIDRIEDTFFWSNSFSNSHTIMVDKVLEDEHISWSFETYDEPFEVSVALTKPTGSLIWLCNSKTTDLGSERLSSSGTYGFSFLKEEDVEGYITIIIDNYEVKIPSYPLILIFGIIGIVIIVKTIKIKKLN